MLQQGIACRLLVVAVILAFRALFALRSFLFRPWRRFMPLRRARCRCVYFRRPLDVLLGTLLALCLSWWRAMLDVGTLRSGSRWRRR
jgi:hypothetical protein